MTDIEFWRSELKGAQYPFIDEICDSELEAWLFQPGSGHLKLLQWGLSQLDPNLEDHLENTSNDKVEDEVVELGKTFGLSRRADDILGKSDRQLQAATWERLFRLIRNNRENHLDTDAYYNELYSLINSSDFWALLDCEAKLIPIKLHHLSPVEESVEQIEGKINVVLGELGELQVEDTGTSIDQDSSADPVLIEEQEIIFKSQLQKVQDCFQNLSKKVFPLLKNRLPGQQAQELGVLLENVAGKLLALVEELKRREVVKHLAESLDVSNQSLPMSDSKVNLCIEKSGKLLCDILALIKTYGLTDL